ncbi:hypothetical protein A2865_04640 [Candidatus Woesebacteria bacterium RIFCSPHIGHO2_01_FULL_39_17]|uniref:Prepilin leader peptidase/N-methyltransferase n=2 Tax=Candidatus Woeseibacteriota TaxID=1752722 RepID=A0A0G0LN10_9BACT|nr:MAG: Type 4 prepilin-like protein leader peptide-processing enzyme [Microgenomates group bacterium GW2011_GWC1_38_12]KKQ93253.1 MAG: Type 4 prepilin-like protein leader peptide-processing enzyme [Candidatus Woesebacteria bacterium GW2011_GWB1_39_10b]OGM23172.1 MAG: hypothetical protein A2865_04640 [Candidatus Woesebacteria bacterium RIFCSPHIGHO2_01_FULL_39_17]
MLYINMIFFLILGLAVGSFLSAYTWRWPRGISIAKGRSICPKCKKQIAWYDNIPLFSYLILGGRCRNCRKKISLRYSLIEVSTGTLFVVTILLLGGLGRLGFPLTTYYLLLTTILIAIFIIDLEHQIIPDELVFIIFGLSLFMLIVSSNDQLYKIIFASFMASTFFLLLHFITRGRGMGLGDAKLVLALSPILGWPQIMVWIFLSFIIGAVVGLFLIAIKKASFGKHIAFGPFLVIAFFITLFWGEYLIGFLLPFL